MRTIAIVTLSLLVLPAAAADVYRSVDAQGNVVYSDRPAAADAVEVTLRTPSPGQPATPPQPATAAPAEPPAEPDQATIEAAERAQLVEDRAANCAIANERNERYSTSRRLYRVDEASERVYLDDAALTQARADAAADVTRWCE